MAIPISMPKMDSFDPDKEKWSIYAKRFRQFFRAYQITDEEQKSALLISNVGASTFQLMISLFSPEEPEDRTFNELVTRLTDHFEPRPLVVVERYKFNTRVQKEEESISEFVSELRRLAINCEYPHMLDELLRDRFVAGLKNETIRKRLLSEPPTQTLAQYVAIARTMSLAERESKLLPHAQSEWPQSVYKVQQWNQRQAFGQQRSKEQQFKEQRSQDDFRFSQSRMKECYRCGKVNHLPKNCRFKDAACNYCQKKGHIAIACRIKKEDENKQVKQVQMDNEEYQIRYVHSIEDAKGEPPVYWNVRINDHLIQVEVDTGSAVSLISETLYGQKFKNVNLIKSNIRLKDYSGQVLKLKGQITVRVNIGLKQHVLPLLVVHGTGPALIGRNWLKVLKPQLLETAFENEQSTVLQLSTEGSGTKIQALTNEFKELFEDKLGEMAEDKLGEMAGPPAHITLKSGARPRFFNPRMVPFALKSRVEEALEQDEKDGILEPIEYSEWAAPIVRVVKPTGKIRVCADFKVTINPYLEVTKYPLPRVEELLMRLNGGEKYTKLDLTRAYNQVPIDRESQNICVINTPKGLRRYKRLPFGVSSAPGLFQSKMDQILSGLAGTAWYLDDIAVTGKDEAEHLKNLRLVFERLQKYNVKLNLAKWEFMKDTAGFVGYVLSKEGVRALPDKRQGVLKMEAPKNVSQLKSFLAKIQYYRKFMKNQSFYTAKLSKLLQRNEVWNWSSECQEAFEALKKQLMSDQLLVHYQPSLQVTLACDASPEGLGAVLSHIMPNGDEKPIAYASKTLTETEKKCAQIEKEAYAIIFGVKRFYPYLFGRKFTLITDHKPLTALFGPNKGIPLLSISRLQRWAILLTSFQCDIVYRNTQLHSNADALSRLPDKDATEVDPVFTEVNALFTRYMEASPITKHRLATETTQDEVLSIVLKYVQKGWPKKDPSKFMGKIVPYAQRKNEITVEEGCLIWKNQLIIPEKERSFILKELHQAHPGMLRMKAFAKRHVWWPGIDKEIETAIRACKECQENRNNPITASKMGKWPEASDIWQRLHIDYAGPFLGYYWLIVVDAKSKWPEVFQMKTMTSTATIVNLRKLFATFGIPSQIVSDNGASFMSDEFEQFCAKNGVKHLCTAPYHPNSNGLAERFVQTFKKAMKTDTENNLQKRLNNFLFQYRSTPHSETGLVPTDVVFGRRIQTRLDIMRRKEVVQVEQEGKFEIRDKVWVKNFSRAYTKQWVPGFVEAKMGKWMYKVKVGDFIWKRHQDQLRNREWESKDDVGSRKDRDKEEVNDVFQWFPIQANVGGNIASVQAPGGSIGPTQGTGQNRYNLRARLPRNC